MIKFNLARVLGEKLMTQSQLSKKTGIRMGTINAYYHGFIRRINVKDLNKICEVLECKLDQIIEYVPDKK